MSSEERERVLILGLGSLGTRVAGCIAEQGIAGIAVAAIDTDRNEIEHLPASVTSILAGSERSWKSGCGCGGNVLRGEQAVAPERQTISGWVEDRSLIIVVGGLGGGTATGGIRTVASVIRAKNIPAVFVLTTPFSFESFPRRKACDTCLDELLPVVDVLIRIPGDLLFSTLPSDTAAEEAYRCSRGELARSVLGICGILNSANCVNADFAGFMEVLRNRKSSCGLGVGSASASDGLDPCGLALKQMLESPFLGGAERIEQADALIVSICGGMNLPLCDVKRTLENVTAMGKKATAILSGFCTAPYMGDSVQTVVIPVKYDEQAPAPDEIFSSEEFSGKQIAEETPKKRVRKKDKMVAPKDFEQGLLNLQTYSKGAFAGMEQNLFEGEDLDIPTFQRRDLVIDKGSFSR